MHSSIGHRRYTSFCWWTSPWIRSKQTRKSSIQHKKNTLKDWKAYPLHAGSVINSIKKSTIDTVVWSPCVGKQSSGKRGAAFTLSWCYCHNWGLITSWLTQHKSVQIASFTWHDIRCRNAGALRWAVIFKQLFFLPLSVRWHHRWSMFYKDKLTLVGKKVLNKADMWKRLMNLMSIASFLKRWLLPLKLHTTHKVSSNGKCNRWRYFLHMMDTMTSNEMCLSAHPQW